MSKLTVFFTFSIFLLCSYHSQAQLPMNCPNLFNVVQVFCGNKDNPSECIRADQVCNGGIDCTTGFDESQSSCLALLNPCEENVEGVTPCQNGGFCAGFSAQEEVSVAYYVCTCTAGWTGTKCDVPIGEEVPIPTLPPVENPVEEDDVIIREPDPAVCSPNPCLNGVCTPLRNGFHCACRPGFGGELCQSGTERACDSGPCRNGAECLNQPGSNTLYTCSCSPGFTGRQCEQDINECLSRPCFNRGECTDLPNGFSCKCPLGFEGEQCEINIDDCFSNPCYTQGGAVCLDQVNGFNCQCNSVLWTGRFCNRRQLCLPPVNDPCRNFGVCVPQEGEVPQCRCQDGYEGRFCEADINECLTRGITCSGRGTCVDGPNSWSCVCNEGFTGEECEGEINPCDPTPCKNDAICCHRNGDNCATDMTPDYYECYCASGFSGWNCQIRYNPCADIPCKNGGICNINGDDYVCTCPLLWGGLTCEEPLPCNSNPCVGLSECIPTGDTYICECSENRVGRYCERTPCIPNPCNYNVACYVRPELESGYQCACPDQYVGPTCSRFSACSSVPCRNGGECTDVGETFRCVCFNGFRGDQCELPPLGVNPEVICGNVICLNGGICAVAEQAPASFRCFCEPGFSGRACEIRELCTLNPCRSRGNCINTENSFRCNCLPPYTGETCERIDGCADAPCRNGGTCNAISDAYLCVCPAAYTGENCETPLVCASNPCRNNAVCNPIPGGFMCDCTDAYTGVLCETFLQCFTSPCDQLTSEGCTNLPNGDYQCQCITGWQGRNCDSFTACANSPCRNGGQCVPRPNGGFFCNCPSPFSGEFCEREESCLSSPCLNQGRCDLIGGGQGFRCTCPAAYTGPLCETYIPCSSSPCLNGGSCSNEGQNYRCSCDLLFGGQNCQIFTPCRSNPCLNNGDCVDSSEGFICRCPGSYTGERCETPVPCASNPCGSGGECINSQDFLTFSCRCFPGFSGSVCFPDERCAPGQCVNGECVVVNGQATCRCPPNFTGARCEQNIGPCLSSPCVNGGFCQEIDPQRFGCSCPIIYTGVRCETRILPCDNQPCRNQGGCSNVGEDNFSCSCPAPFTGLTCESVLSTCGNQPCLNGGTCREVGGGFVCACVAPYTGPRCEAAITSCTPFNPCQRGGTCQQDSLGVFCRCPPGYEGLFCEFASVSPLEQCSVNPCLNGGLCSENNGVQECECLRGWEGSRCGVRIEGCGPPNPCAAGNCMESVQGRFMCTCPPEFIGERCSILNPCYSGPCVNGGSCSVEFDSSNQPIYRCTCPASFGGVNCEISQGFTPCSSNPCINNGVCEVRNNGQTFFCICPSEFAGVQCEQRVVTDMCRNNLCENNARCINEQNGYRCQCSVGFSGEFCSETDTCSTQPCANGATCLNLRSEVYFTGYTCICPPQRTGARCDVFDFCSSAPCLNGAQCAEQSQFPGYRCACTDGWTGERCDQRTTGCTVDSCNGNGQCIPQGTSGFQCQCNPGYQGLQCQIGPCNNGGVCQNGGQCTSRPDGSFGCTCVGAWVGNSCEIPAAGIQPSFSRGSYLALPPYSGAPERTLVQLQVYPRVSSGIVMFMGQGGTDQRITDILMIALDNGIVKVGVNLGSGPFVLDGAPIQTNRWTRIRVSRTERQTLLTVDDVTVQGETPAGTTALNSDSAIYLGGIPNDFLLNPNVDLPRVFDGCIQSFAIGTDSTAEVNLASTQGSLGVTRCTTTSNNNLCPQGYCSNSGQCTVSGDLLPVCTCPLGFSGARCDLVVTNPIPPYVNGNGYIAVDDRFSQSQPMFVSMEIRADQESGLLLYNSIQSAHFSITLRSGQLILTYNLGFGGTTLLTSNVVTGTGWSMIRAQINGPDGQIQLDQGPAVTGRTPPGSSQTLRFGRKTYIGGIAGDIQADPIVPLINGFTGCIRNVRIQGIELDWSSVREGLNMGECPGAPIPPTPPPTVSPCLNNRCTSGSTCRTDPGQPDGYRCDCPPNRTGTFCDQVVVPPAVTSCDTLPSGGSCGNGGRCFVSASQNTPYCYCPLGFTGETCQQAASIQTAFFDRLSYIEYAGENFIGPDHTGIEIILSTSQPNGMIAWLGNYNTEYLGLGLRNGTLYLDVRTASGTIRLNSSPRRMDNNVWFQAYIIVSNQGVYMDVADANDITVQYSEQPPNHLPLRLPTSTSLFLGGMPDNMFSTTGSMYTQGIVGCVIQLRGATERQNYRIVEIQNNAMTGFGVDQC